MYENKTRRDVQFSHLAGRQRVALAAGIGFERRRLEPTVPKMRPATALLHPAGSAVQVSVATTFALRRGATVKRAPVVWWTCPVDLLVTFGRRALAPDVLLFFPNARKGCSLSGEIADTGCGASHIRQVVACGADPAFVFGNRHVESIAFVACHFNWMVE